MTRTIDDLLALMQRLRDPETGCPWDRAQTLSSLVKHTLEEAYEVADAVAREDQPALALELGDLLFQVVFYGQIARENGDFDFHTIVTALHEKLVRRHPHLFGTTETGTTEELTGAWEAAKAAERAALKPAASELDDVPLALPALSRAAKLQKRAARVGFDWPSAAPVFDKVLEELEELRVAVAQPESRQAQQDELGDLIFTAVNLGRHLGLDAEEAVRAANAKFERRFHFIEAHLRRTGRQPTDADLAELDTLWAAAKRTGL